MCFNFRLVQQRSHDKSHTSSIDGAPPPLPNKENRRSLNSTLELISSPKLTGPASPGASPHNSIFFGGPQSDFSSSMGQLAPSYISDMSASPMSRSPGSSIGSGLNRSAEELIDSVSLLSDSQLSSGGYSRTSSETVGAVQYSSSASATCVSSQSSQQQQIQSVQTMDQFNHFSHQMNQLTSDISAIGVRSEQSINNRRSGAENGTTEEIPPSLPSKKLSRLPSQYDNMFENMQLQQQQASVINRHSFEGRMSSSSVGSSQSFSGLQIQKSNTISFSHRTSSQETYSSSETFSSASHSSLESLNRPPPLPPKNRHSKLRFNSDLIFYCIL